MKVEYKTDDRLLVRGTFGGYYHVYVLFVKDGWFGKKYFCEWTVHNLDYDIVYKERGYKRNWQIVNKD